jgi:hypothetical protein
MKGAARLSVALAASVACAALTTIAKAADFDWKMYAGAAVLKPEACFYDACTCLDAMFFSKGSK